MSERFTATTADDPHRDQPIETAGAPPQAAEAAVVMLHGRGSTAKYILRLVDECYHHGVLYLAPQAAHRTWYPRSMSLEGAKSAAGSGVEAEGDTDAVTYTHPWFDSALAHVSTALDTAADAGVPLERTLLFGFSQGGALASEFVARTPRRYGGLVVFSGGLLEPEHRGRETGSLEGTPVFLGCSDDDPYVPAERVRESARVLEALGGDVTVRLYDGLGHEINDDEMQTLDTLVGNLL
ncbi:alpha/beta hydrolase [Natronosalvus vescus]|uniref:alpha/beta hydrolase n=1 Tax=Natronosalvus vescus TaxID=2953881 RepID=UPI002091343A|nr:dienelactone hydrolase family protein [Natronosalvus vescus]